MKTCFQLTTALQGCQASAFPITVAQAANRRFRVTYGQQVKEDLDYAQAAQEFGECVFHALACEGRLDNSETPLRRSRSRDNFNRAIDLQPASDVHSWEGGDR